MSQFQSLLRKAVADFISLSDEQFLQLSTHYNLLVQWNRRLNLTAIRNVEDAVNHHYVESLFLASHLPDSGTIVDVGSGAGFPGVPIAVARPLSSVSLVESHRRKTVFLTESCRHLTNTRIEACRFEDFNCSWETLVSRAVAWRDICHQAAVVAESVALLASAEDAKLVRQTSRFTWREPIPLPSASRGYLLLGRRSTWNTPQLE